MNYKLAIFDLDGTILDTLDDLHASVCFSLIQNGLPPRTLEEVRRFVGNGIGNLIQLSVPEGTSKEKIDLVTQDFFSHYAVHCADQTRPYPGIRTTLMTLRHIGVKLAVVSNKADAPVQELSRKFFPDIFDFAVGERKGIRRKPKPDSVNEVLRVLQIDRRDAVYIGDSDVDILTAKNAGMDCLSVLWGFRDREFLMGHGASRLVEKPQDLTQLIVGELSE